MLPLLSTLTVLLGVPVSPVETFYVQVAPAPRAAKEVLRSPAQQRAVVLIHGLRVHPFNFKNVGKAVLHEWQKPGSLIVKLLGQDADVYSFAYAQNEAVEVVAAGPGLKECVGRLREMGYRSIVLVGHSAGGLLARHFVEDNPECGVTRVIQACAPNGGSNWAEWRAVLPTQDRFLYSLTREARQVILHERAGKAIPGTVEFVCIVGTGVGFGDGLVLCRCQWTEELQRQGVPCFPLDSTHWMVPRVRAGAELIARLAREPVQRWNERQVAEARKQVLKE
jgi:pimeloyl-ACP methyl ester carboxylesterase